MGSSPWGHTESDTAELAGVEREAERSRLEAEQAEKEGAKSREKEEGETGQDREVQRKAESPAETGEP